MSVKERGAALLTLLSQFRQSKVEEVDVGQPPWFAIGSSITPVEFWKKYVGPADLEDYVCLVDDPRTEHAKGKKIGIVADMAVGVHPAGSDVW